MDPSIILPALIQILAAAWKRVTWLILFLPGAIKKLFWLTVDLRNGVRQSRKYYHRIQFKSGDTETFAYQEIDSNGKLVRHVTAKGDQILLPISAGPHIVAQYQQPRVKWWRKIDWRDIFNGSWTSGRQAISDPRIR